MPGGKAPIALYRGALDNDTSGAETEGPAPNLLRLNPDALAVITPVVAVSVVSVVTMVAMMPHHNYHPGGFGGLGVPERQSRRGEKCANRE